MMAPVIDQVEKEYPNIEIVRIDADQDTGMVSNYNVSSIPTYILLEDGLEIDRMNGARTKEEFLKFARVS
jgi:thioredoxin 1